MPYPAVSGTLAANPNPAVFDAGPLGKITVDGVLSGDAFYQSNNVPHNASGYVDLTNAQVIINKTDGIFQFYVQAGAYSIPTLGVAYTKTGPQDTNTYGFVPQGFVKIVPNSNFSVLVGALPSLIGGEYTFSFENLNIERGLLWNLEPAISRGVQVNYTQGPIAVSAAYTDGYYSNTYTAISGLITYTFKNSDTLAFAAEGNVATNNVATLATPLPANNGQIYNLLYSHTSGPWTISPYFQYSNTPNIRQFGVLTNVSGSTVGGAILAKYSFTPEFSLAGRFEYVSTQGQANLLGFGAGSNAWSITVTPTYQKGIYFARAEFSYVGVGSGTPGLLFGNNFDTANQSRVLIETGVSF
ncbi:MAG TPA: outer membrane beta-barrel protein [Caulobacteraceae bacterium]|nr:outer membrane beta-barrel protein [Caulobacteraceae bacterium]